MKKLLMVLVVLICAIMPFRLDAYIYNYYCDPDVCTDGAASFDWGSEVCGRIETSEDNISDLYDDGEYGRLVWMSPDCDPNRFNHEGCKQTCDDFESFATRHFFDVKSGEIYVCSENIGELYGIFQFLGYRVHDAMQSGLMLANGAYCNNGDMKCVDGGSLDSNNRCYKFINGQYYYYDATDEDYFKSCSRDSDCAAGNWGTSGSYQMRYKAKCDMNRTVCVLGDPEYRCAPNYYGTGTNCTSCKNSHSAAVSIAGSTSINNCYIPANARISDDTGTYTFMSDCYY